MDPFTATTSGHRHRRFRCPAKSLSRLAGTSFKPEHLDAILAGDAREVFFEVHAENYMGEGGPRHRQLERIRSDYPISLHGVAMSIGGPHPLDEAHLTRFRRLVERYEPALVSEHLAWSTHGTAYFNDLLPLPYTEATLALVCEHVEQMQTAIGRPILLENPSTYVRFTSSTMREAEFLEAVVRRTGCGLLLDVNNVVVSAANHGFAALDYLTEIPLGAVGEIHLAGHVERPDDAGGRLLIDSHDTPVADAVWRLYEWVIARCGPIATLVEWDSRLPEWPVLLGEAVAARAILDEATPRSLGLGDHAA